MRITEFTYKRVIKTADYESESLEATAIVGEGDAVNDMKDLRAKVKSVIESEGTGTVNTTTKVAAKTDVPAAKVKKPTKREETKEVKETVEKKDLPAKRQTNKKPKTVAYNREVPLHRDNLLETLVDIDAEWQTKLVGTPGELSEECKGMEFMDSNGVVLPSFKEFVATKVGSGL